MIPISRPSRESYPQYYRNYINQVPDGDLTEILGTNATAHLSLLENIRDWDYRYAPGKWSVKELLLHVIDSERVFCYRALRMARGDRTPLPGYDQDLFAANCFADQRTGAGLVNEYRSVREATLTLLGGLHPTTFTKTGIANDGLISVAALFYVIAGHELHHIRVLKEKYTPCL